MIISDYAVTRLNQHIFTYQSYLSAAIKYKAQRVKNDI